MPKMMIVFRKKVPKRKNQEASQNSQRRKRP